MMARPSLPKAEDIARIAKLLRSEGFNSFCIETAPDGRVSITAGEADNRAGLTELDKWKAKRGAA